MVRLSLCHSKPNTSPWAARSLCATNGCFETIQVQQSSCLFHLCFSWGEKKKQKTKQNSTPATRPKFPRGWELRTLGLQKSLCSQEDLASWSIGERFKRTAH